MILHFLTDDKFSEYVLQQFEGHNRFSDFIIVAESEHLVNVDIHRYSNVNIVSPAAIEMNGILETLKNYQAIVLHGMFWPWEECILKNKPDGLIIAWMFWGGDIYGRKDLQLSFLAPKTKSLLFFQQIKRFIKRRLAQSRPYEIPRNLFSKVDYCLTDIKEEYDFASAYLTHKMGHLWYNYYSIEETIGPLSESRVEGNNILINNSGTIEGNHLDVFKRLKSMNLNGRKVIVPLSYGDSWLINRILKEGRKDFNSSFTPLTEFLPREQYNRVLASCSSVVMNHYRPQALGNIITALWIGARVYMSERSLQYKYLKNNGIVLFSIEKELSLISESRENLPESDVLNNRQILKSIYSKEVMNQRITELINVLNS